MCFPLLNVLMRGVSLYALYMYMNCNSTLRFYYAYYMYTVQREGSHIDQNINVRGVFFLASHYNKVFTIGPSERSAGVEF